MVRIIKQENHVATCLDSCHSALWKIPQICRCLHADIITENRALEPELATQDLLDPDSREAGWQSVYVRIDHMRHHHGCHASLTQALKRQDILFKQLAHRALILR